MHVLRRVFLMGLMPISICLSCQHLPTPTATPPPPVASVAAVEDTTELVPSQPSELPSEVNEHVLQWINYFQGRGRPHMERYLSRAARYMPMMRTILKEKGLPPDLVYLALIESGFSATARSRAGAVGFWQLIKPTGQRYGLRVDNLIDERQDPVLSTHAAANYFRGLHSLFGSWHLAIAAYNVGENRVKNALMNNYTRNFWDLVARRQLPRETMDYVPKFIAASLIARDPEKYGFSGIHYQPTFEFEEVTVHRPVDLRRLAQLMQASYDDLKSLNPSFRTQKAPLSRSGTLVLRVAKGASNQAYAVVPQCSLSPQELRTDRRPDGRPARRPARTVAQTRTLPKKESKKESSRVHVVRRGETLIHIANRYNIPLYRLAEENRLSKRSKILIGRRLVIPEETN